MLEVTTYDRSHFRIITIIVYTIPIYSVMSQTTPSVSLTNPNVQANYGSSVTLGCVMSANPAATSVYWQKKVGNNAPITIDMSNTAKYTGATVANPSLQINNLNTNDQAKYICFAANSVGTGQSTQGTLTVVGSPPVVTMPEPSYTINIGNSITIACSITSNPDHTSVYWTRRIGNNQEEQISTTGQSSSKYSGSTVNSPSLVIYNVQFSDAGQYNCHATNIVGTGQASTPTNLNVVGNVPTVTASIPSSVRIGTSVTIVCTVDANPAATQIIWQFVTNNAPSNIDISGNSRFSGGDANLTINPVRESDEGTYRCQAINSEGTGTSNTVYLDTTGDPPINVAVTPNPLTVTEGEKITAVCSAQGTPAPSYEWRKFGSATVIATGATLSIGNSKETDATSYTCRAYNSFGSNEASLNVNVQYRPKVQITNHSISGKLAQSATIQCLFKSNPFASNVQWKKVVGGIETNINIDSNKYQGGTLTSPSLTIFNLAASDQADYFCTATNSVGTGRSNRGSLTVDVRTSPMGIQIFPGQITVLEGNDFSIYCNATANPAPTYEWFHKDVRVGTGQTFNLQNSNWAKHDGLYTCKAENEIGCQEATIDVDVKYPPVSAVTQNTFYPVLNSPITLTCNTKANPSATSWKWFQNGFEIVGQNEKTLPIAMKESDVGQYHCIAYNKVGQSPSIFFSVQIYGTQLVVKIPVNSYQELVGNSITIGCQVSSPNSALQSVQWIFTNQIGQVTDPVVIISPKYSGSTTTSPSLTINNVQFSDEGTYRCRATNLIETTTSTDTAILDIYKNKQEQNSTVFVAVISALAVALVTSIIVIVICWLKRKTAEKSTIGGQKRRSETYEARSGEHHSHLYDTIDTYERLSVQQNTNGISVTNINGTSNSSPDYQTESIELYHRYTEIT